MKKFGDGRVRAYENASGGIGQSCAPLVCIAKPMNLPLASFFSHFFFYLFICCFFIFFWRCQRFFVGLSLPASVYSLAFIFISLCVANGAWALFIYNCVSFALSPIRICV